MSLFTQFKEWFAARLSLSTKLRNSQEQTRRLREQVRLLEGQHDRLTQELSASIYDRDSLSDNVREAKLQIRLLTDDKIVLTNQVSLLTDVLKAEQQRRANELGDQILMARIQEMGAPALARQGRQRDDSNQPDRTS